MKDALGMFVPALADLERQSKGHFSAATYLSLCRVSNLAAQLHRGDRVDFIAPVVFEIGASQQAAGEGATKVKPTGNLKVGMVVTLQDRALFAWQQGTTHMQPASAVVFYESIEAVNDIVFRVKMANSPGLEVIADKRWPIMLTNNPKAPDMSFWRRVLRHRLDGTYQPLWEADRVTRWMSPSDAAQEAFLSPASQRLWDIGWLKEHLGEGEAVRAAIGGGLILDGREGPNGLLAMTGSRVIACGKKAKPSLLASHRTEEVRGATRALLSELLGGSREAEPYRSAAEPLRQALQESGIDDLEVVALRLADGTVWLCISEAGDPTEGEEFASAVRRACNL